MAFSGRRVPRVPRTVSWILTLECDHRCKHCYVEAGTRTPGELSPAARRSVLLELVRAGVRFVIFSGGDPLRCSDLPDLLELARGFGLHTAVCTTAGSLDEAMARRLRDLGVSLVSLSLDAPLAEDHDRLRGLPGSFQRTIEALRRCRRVGLAVELDTTLTRPTGSDVLALLTLAEENGATSVDLRRFVPLGRGARFAGELTLAPAEHHRLQRKWYGDPRLAEGRLRTCSHDPLLRLTLHPGRGLAVTLARLRDRHRCLAGRDWFGLMPDGEVRACPLLPLPLGKVPHDELAEVWRYSSLLATLHDPAGLRGACRTCRHRFLCLGGCHAHAFAQSGDPRAPDPLCPFLPSERLCEP